MEETTLNHTDYPVFTTAQVDSNDTDYTYYYDYDESVNYIPVDEIVPVAIVYGLTLLFGVTGNTLVIFSIIRIQRMRNVTNIFLMSLASSDLIVVLVCVPIKFAKWFSFTWDFGEFLCKGVHYLQNVSIICSVLTLTTMSLERYYAILNPIKSKYMCTVKHARVVLAVVWVMAFVLASPIIYGQILKEVGTIRVGHWCIKEWSKHEYEKAYELGMLCLVFVVPLAIMTFAYASICRELWVVSASRKSMISSGNSTKLMNHHSGSVKTNDEDRTRKQNNVLQVIKMLVAIILLFAVCHGPSLIDNVLVAFGHVNRLHYGDLKHMRQAFSLMSYFNSCVNPLVYAFMSRNFRESFRLALCMCLYRRNTRQRSVTFQGYSRASNVENFTLTTTNNASPRPSRQTSPESSPRNSIRQSALSSNCLLVANKSLQQNNRLLSPHYV